MGLFSRPDKKLSDERLMELVARGDETAFTTLYDRYQARLFAFFRRMLWNDRELAADALQDLFTKIIQRPDAYDGGRPFSTWLYSVANNMCKNIYRSKAVRTDALPYLKAESPGIHDTDPGRAVDHAHFRERLDAELDTLDPDQKATFVMRYDEEMAIKEIAAVFSISEGTVKSRLFYTLKKLAERLTEFDPRILDHGKARTVRS